MLFSNFQSVSVDSMLFTSVINFIMQMASIMAGISDGTFGPMATANRAEVATIFSKFLDTAR